MFNLLVFKRYISGTRNLIFLKLMKNKHKQKDNFQAKEMKIDYYKRYVLAYNNAVDLVAEARLLFEHKYFSRAYTLAFTALEEISKSQFAADVFTNFSKEEDFLNFYRNHADKIMRIRWVHYDANSYPHNIIWIGPNRDDVEKIGASKPFLKKRNNSFYVGIENDKIILPKNEISEKDAKEIIHTVDIAFQRICEITECYGHNIGTKGFMK